jgi:hypothetical protein
MRRPTGFIVLLLAPMLLAGCVMFKDVSYFAPRSTAEVAADNTFRGLPEIARYRFASTQFRLLILERGPQLRVLFVLSEGETARFVGDKVRAVPLDIGEVVTGRVEPIQANHITDGRGRFHYTPPTEPLIGATYLAKATAIPRSFEVTDNFSRHLPENFILELPNIVLSGTEYAQPRLVFSRRVGSAYQGVPP